jgi:hypothetical protein
MVNSVMVISPDSYRELVIVTLRAFTEHVEVLSKEVILCACPPMDDVPKEGKRFSVYFLVTFRYYILNSLRNIALREPQGDISLEPQGDISYESLGFYRQ